MSETPDVYLYPRISDTTGRTLSVDMANIDHGELVAWGSLAHSEAAPNPTGGRPASRAKLEAIQSLVRGLALDFGFPTKMTVSKQAEFDRICGTLLYREMDIVPADAGHREVWTFLTMVLLPEIAPWRFRDRSEDRLLGGTRNTFQRLWWRAWSLGPDLTESPLGCPPLGEDEYVQIMERPTLAGNQRVAKAVQSALWESATLGLPIQRATLLRALVIRVRAARSHLSFDSLTDPQLMDLLRELRSDSASALSAGDHLK